MSQGQYLITVEYVGTSNLLAGFEVQHAINRDPDLHVLKLERVIGVVEEMLKAPFHRDAEENRG